MARTAITVQNIDQDGATITYAAGDATNDHSVLFQGKPLILHFKNSGAIAVATILTPGKTLGIDIEDISVTIPATTGNVMVYVPCSSVYMQADGKLYIDLDVDTGVTLAALQTP